MSSACLKSTQCLTEGSTIKVERLELPEETVTRANRSILIERAAKSGPFYLRLGLILSPLRLYREQLGVWTVLCTFQNSAVVDMVSKSVCTRRWVLHRCHIRTDKHRRLYSQGALGLFDDVFDVIPVLEYTTSVDMPPNEQNLRDNRR